MRWDAARRVVPCGRSTGARSGAVAWRHRGNGRAQMWAGAPTSETGRPGPLGASHGGRSGFVRSDSARPEKSCHRLRDDEAERRRDRRPIASRVHHDTAGPRRGVGGVVRGHRLSPDGRLARIRGEANDSTGCGGFDLALRAGSRSKIAVDDPTAMGAGQHRVQHSQCRRGAASRQGPVCPDCPGPARTIRLTPSQTPKRRPSRNCQGPRCAHAPSRPEGRAPGARAEPRGAPGWRGAQRDDRIRDGRR